MELASPPGEGAEHDLTELVNAEAFCGTLEIFDCELAQDEPAAAAANEAAVAANEAAAEDEPTEWTYHCLKS
jgi:hypothetical protein